MDLLLLEPPSSPDCRTDRFNPKPIEEYLIRKILIGIMILMCCSLTLPGMPVPSGPGPEEENSGGNPIGGGMTPENEHLLTEILFWGSAVLISLLVISI